MQDRLALIRTNWADPRFIELETELDEFLRALNGELDEFFSEQNHSTPLEQAVVALLDERPVACGAFKFAGEGAAEIKRMYTAPDVRGARIGERVLQELLGWAAELGASQAILETHVDLLAARRLYERTGFERIPNYPPYQDVEVSVCYSKAL